MQGDVRRVAFATAPQDERVTRFDAQTGRVDSDVWATLIDHADDTDRCSHLANAKPIRQLPALYFPADWVGERRDLVQRSGHGKDSGLIEGQPIEHRGRSIKVTEVVTIRSQDGRTIASKCD